MKAYLGLVIFLLIVSYLSPKEKYEKYFQFLVGIIIAVMILEPLSVFFQHISYEKGDCIEEYLDTDAIFFGKEKED